MGHYTKKDQKSVFRSQNSEESIPPGTAGVSPAFAAGTAALPGNLDSLYEIMGPAFRKKPMPEQLVFKNRNAFRIWLLKNHSRREGLWLVFGKNNAIETLTPEEALEEALCFGWIDGLVKRVDETRYVKFFSPRRAKSKWSEKNKKTAERLIRRGRMTSSGRQAIERAKQDGLWDPQRRMIVTSEDINRFAQVIIPYPQAAGNFQKMPPSVKKLFAGFYMDAKQEETRRRRLEKLVTLLEQNKKPM